VLEDEIENQINEKQIMMRAKKVMLKVPSREERQAEIKYRILDNRNFYSNKLYNERIISSFEFEK
jgi:hypothetical protein